MMRHTEEQPGAARAAAKAGVDFVHERYSLEAERRDLVEVFAPRA
jgi:hypothetical protein